METELTSSKSLAILLSGFLLMITSVTSVADRLSLPQAEQIALSEEPGLISQQLKARSLNEMAIADGQHMDPKLQIGILNLPLDTFDFDQEAMTQFKIGYLQQFPPGDTRHIKMEKSQKQSELVQTQISNRNITILKNVRLTYLELYYWEQAKKTIQKNRVLFEQLIEIVQSLFSVGRNNQQDLIRAQLELSRLDDRVSKIEQQIITQRAKLSRWVGMHNSNKPLTDKLPEFTEIDDSRLNGDFEEMSNAFLTHPQVTAIDKKLELSRKDIQLVNESLKPGWGLNLGYSYRDDAPNGISRADFISAVATIDLPVFSANRQDKQRLAKEYEYQSLKNDRLELIRQLVAELQQELANQTVLKKRQQLYNKLLLPQARQQAQAAMLAYQSDQGKFSDVMRAYMDDLNSKLDERRIAIDLAQTKAKILYYVVDTTR